MYVYTLTPLLIDNSFFKRSAYIFNIDVLVDVHIYKVVVQLQFKTEQRQTCLYQKSI